MNTPKRRTVSLNELVAYSDALLNTPGQQDYCPNGLQIAGRPEIGKIVSGVSANLALIDAALDAEADLVLVHHGFFWKNEDPRLIGIRRNRIARLLSTNLSLLVYHLPLDIHPVYGNNVRLGQELGLEIDGPLPEEPMIWTGRMPEERSGAVFSTRILRVLNRQALHIPGTKRPIRRVAWCSGAGQNLLEIAALAGMDAYVTGEVSEWTVHTAKEYNIHFFAAGHHATERLGVQALGGHLAEKFGIEHQFIEIDNPA
jgi:dinuclear metal center YbgI/SA1388 family protein